VLRFSLPIIILPDAPYSGITGHLVADATSGFILTQPHEIKKLLLQPGHAVV
jgi:hypothetical protein